MRDRYPVHGKRRRLWVLWTVGCRCGMDAWPCPVEEMLQARHKPQHADETYPGPLRVQGWRDSGGVR